jgi:hypothetical protein
MGQFTNAVTAGARPLNPMAVSITSHRPFHIK